MAKAAITKAREVYLGMYKINPLVRTMMNKLQLEIDLDNCELELKPPSPPPAPIKPNNPTPQGRYYYGQGNPANYKQVSPVYHRIVNPEVPKKDDLF